MESNLKSLRFGIALIILGGPLINFEDEYNALKKFEHDLKKKEEISSPQIELDKCHNRRSINSGDSPQSLLPPPPPPPIRFYISPSPLHTQFDITWIMRKFKVVDEDVIGIFPRSVSVYVSDGQFDTDNWRFVRGEENNRTYMVAFYGGGYGQVGFHGDIVNVPYNRGVTLVADVYFFVALISGIGFRFAFLY